MSVKSKSGKPGTEVSSICPDCGAVLVRPVEFSAERLLYLHQKWGGCSPAGQRVGAPAGSESEAGSRSAAG